MTVAAGPGRGESRGRGSDPDLLARAAEAAGLVTGPTRRSFLVLSAGAATGIVALGVRGAFGAEAPIVILENAQGLLLSDPSRCVGCLRCELTCTEHNDGRAQPALARIRVSRNLAFGPEGPTGGAAMQGSWGNGLVAPDTCRQCPHPGPCATACPEEAILSDPKTGARFVDEAACVGCRLCRRACPWDLIVFDEAKGKATKCFLCDGAPKCVEACPSGALRYVPWRDVTREAPPRTAVAGTVPPRTAQACLDCHVPRGRE